MRAATPPPAADGLAGSATVYVIMISGVRIASGAPPILYDYVVWISRIPHQAADSRTWNLLPVAWA